MKQVILMNIFIIDWDDTLFPTSWVNKNKINMNDVASLNKYKLYFIELDNNIYNLLNNINNDGDIYIVTNANLKWIESCLLSLNKTSNLIISNNIRIVSARDLYTEKYKDPIEWKVATFQDIIADILAKVYNKISSNDNSYLNILSFGDAVYEYKALINLDNFFKLNCDDIKYFLKNIKFIEKPEFDYLIDELNATNKNIKTIINKLEFVDLTFT